MAVVFAEDIVFAAELPDKVEAELFREEFDDGRLLDRGWYDGSENAPEEPSTRPRPPEPRSRAQERATNGW